ncbi:MAG: hypothetical protein ACD_15C00137G0013 [uncultured bacterium]|nr:MAG: hypothetical protein ACD_15C00137G0013 [uncultured bacterium]
MLKNLLNSKKDNMNSRQESFIQSLEGIGDILVFETKRKKNKFVIKNLKEIFNIFEYFFAIKDKDPEKFEKLVLGQDYLNLYKKNKREAGLRLAFNPEHYMVGFSSIIDQLVRIHEAGVLSGNDEISRSAAVHLTWILEIITSSPNNDIFVEQILRTMSNVGRLAMEHDDRSAYLALISWYSHSVFGVMEGEKLHLPYLETLDGVLFGNVQNIVSDNKRILFNQFISSFVDGLHVSMHNDAFRFSHIFMHADFKKYSSLDDKVEIEKKTRELDESYEKILSIDSLNKWLREFDELKAILELHFPEIEKKKTKKAEAELRKAAISKFKYNNLLEIVFLIGAYCVFKEKYEFINDLWEYKQPSDSDASWVGEDIVPENLEKLISFYFTKGVFERKLDFREGHRGSERYYKFYFLLLLLRYLRKMPSSIDGHYPKIDNFRLPDLGAGRLSSIEHETSELLTLADDLMKKEKLLYILGFSTDSLEELSQKLKYFFVSIKEKAKLNLEIIHRNQDISLKKIEEFEAKFVTGFNENANFRDIFKEFLHQYNESLSASGGERLGINEVIDKAIFFDSWYIHYSDMGEHYGSNFAILEDSYLFDKVFSHCKEEHDLNNILDKFENLEDVFIVYSGVGNLFSKNKNFHTKWSNDTEGLDVKGFEGRYGYKDKFVPVFEVNNKRNVDCVLILNKGKFGSLNQYSSLNGESSDTLRDIFYIKIEAFSQNKSLMEKLIKNPPKWLVKMGEDNKIADFLSTKAQVQIFESYEFRRNADFEGYSIIIKA